MAYEDDIDEDNEDADGGGGYTGSASPSPNNSDSSGGKRPAPPAGYSEVPPPPDGYDVVPAPDDDSFWGGLPQLAKGAARSLVGALGPAAKGAAYLGQAAGLTDDAANSGLYKYGEAVEQGAKELIPASPEEEKTVAFQAGSAGGSILPMAAVGPLAALALGVGQIGLQGAAEQGDEAAAAGATPEQTNAAVLKGGGLGALLGVIFPGVAKVLRPFERSSPGLMDWARTTLKNATAEGTTFAGVSEAQAYLSKQIAQSYDPNATYVPDAGRIISSLAAGAAFGGFRGAREKVPQDNGNQANVDPQNPGAVATNPGEPTRPIPASRKIQTQEQRDVQPTGNQGGVGNAAGTAAVATPPAKQPAPNPGGGERSERIYGKLRQQAAMRQASPETFTLGEDSEEAGSEADEAIGKLSQLMKPGEQAPDVQAALNAATPMKVPGWKGDVGSWAEPQPPARPTGPAQVQRETGQPYEQAAQEAAKRGWTLEPAPQQVQPAAAQRVNPAQTGRGQLSVPPTGRGPLNALLARPDIAQAINSAPVNRANEVPYVAGASQGNDPTINIDNRVPPTAKLPSGKMFPTVEPMVIHETVEKAAMDQMIADFRQQHSREPQGQELHSIYEAAHHEYAEPAEDAYYRQRGIDPAEANAWWAQQDKITEKADPAKAPPNLYTKPYPHDQVKGSRAKDTVSQEVAAEAEQPTQTPAQVAAGVVPGAKGKAVVAKAKKSKDITLSDAGADTAFDKLKGIGKEPVGDNDLTMGSTEPETNRDTGERINAAIAEPHVEKPPEPVEKPAQESPSANPARVGAMIVDAAGNPVAEAKSEPAARLASRALKVAKEMFDKHAPTEEVNPEKEADRAKLLHRLQGIKADADDNLWNDYNPRPADQGKLPEQMWMRDVAANAGKKRLTKDQAAKFIANELQLRGRPEDVAGVRESRRVENDERKRAPTTEQATPSGRIESAAEAAPEEPTTPVTELKGEALLKALAERHKPVEPTTREPQKLSATPAGETLAEKSARLKALRLANPDKVPEQKRASKAGTAKPHDEEDTGTAGEAKPEPPPHEDLDTTAKKEAGGMLNTFKKLMLSEAGGVPGHGKPDLNAVYRSILYGVKGLRSLVLRGNDSIIERMDRHYGGPDKNPLRRAQEAIMNMTVNRRKYAMQDAEIRHRVNDMEGKYPKHIDDFNTLLSGESRAQRYAHLDNTTKAQGHRVTGEHEAWNNARYDELKATYDALPNDLKQLHDDIHDMVLDRTQAKQQARMQAMMDYRKIKDAGLAQRVVEGTVTGNDVAKHGMETLDALARSGKMGESTGPYIPLTRAASKWAVMGRHNIDAPDSFTKRFTDDNGKPLNKYEFDNRDDADAFGNAQKNRPTRNSYFVDQTGERFHVEQTMETDANGVQHMVDKEVPYTKEDALLDPSLERRWSVDANDNHLELHDTKHEAMNRMVEMLKSGEFANINREPRRYDPLQQGGGQRGDFATAFGLDADKALRNNELFKRMSDHQKTVMRQAWAETKLEALNSSSTFNSRLRRQGITGFSSDTGESLRLWSEKSAHELARLEAMPTIDLAREEANDRIKVESERPRDPNDPRANETMRGALNELEKRWDRVLNNTGNVRGAAMAPLVRDILTMSNMKRLLTPAFYTRNGTQVFTHAQPLLGAEFGPKNAFNQLTRAYGIVNPRAVIADSGRQALKMLKSVTGRAPGVDLRSNVLDNILSRVKDPDQRRAMQAMIDNDAISDRAAYQLPDQQSWQPVKFDFGNGPNALRSAMDAMGTKARQVLHGIADVNEPLSNSIEVINRAVNALGAYTGAREHLGMNHDQAVRFATDQVRKAQVNYSDANKPNWAVAGLGGWTRIPWQFKEFGRRQYENFVDNFERIANPQQPGDRQAGLLAVGGLLLTHQLLAGFLHLPWEPVRLALIAANAFGLRDQDWSDVQTWMQSATTNAIGLMTGEHNVAAKLSQALMHGLPNLAGVDLSGGLGLENSMVFGEPQNSGHSRDHMNALWQWFAQTAFGGTGGMGADMINGMFTALNQQDYGKALEQALPLRLPVDVAKAIGGYTEGKLGPRGQVQSAPYNVPEALARGAGFQLSRDAAGGQEAHAVMVAKNRASEAKTRLTDAYVTASPDKKGAAYSAALKGGVLPAELSKAQRDTIQAPAKSVNNFPVTNKTRDLVTKITNAYPR